MKSKQQIKEYRRKYYLKNKDRIKMQNEQTRKKNPHKALARYRKYAKTKKGKYAIYKSNAKRRGLVFDINLKEFEQITNSKCYFCGDNACGIDRLDSTIGYIKGNMVPSCAMCNKMKQTYTEQEFVEKCKQITNTWKRSALSTW